MFLDLGSVFGSFPFSLNVFFLFVCMTVPIHRLASADAGKVAAYARFMPLVQILILVLK